MKKYINLGVIFYFLLTSFHAYAQENRDVDLSPSTIFMHNPALNLSKTQQKERIRIGKIVQLIVKDDSLSTCSEANFKKHKINNCYFEYTSEYVIILNKYIRTLSEEQRKSIHDVVKSHNLIENCVISSYIKQNKDKAILDLSLADALEIGLTEELYKENINNVKKVNEFTQGDNSVSFVGSKCSIFCPLVAILNRVDNDPNYSIFEEDLNKLNRKF